MTTATPVAENGHKILDLPLSSIVPAPDNPRRDLGDVDELAASMSELGMLQPLVVTERDGKFMVVCGHRRHAGAKKAKLKSVPAIARELDEPQRIKARVIENCQRSDLAPLEEARAYLQLGELGLSQRQIAKDVGKGQSHVSKRLSLLQLPKKLLAKLDSGGITIGDALEFAPLAEHPRAIDAALKRMNSWGWTPKQAVKAEREQLAVHLKVEKEIERIKAAGITFVPQPANGYYYELPKGTMRVDPDRSWDSLPMKIGAHSKLDCHAATVDTHGNRIYLCTDPKAHAGELEAAKKRATKDAREEKRKAHEKDLRAAERERRAAIAEILKARMPKDELIEQLVTSLIRETWQSKRKIACGLLDLDAEAFEQTQREDGYGWADKWELALQAEAKKPTRTGAVGLALAIAATEETIHKAWDGWQRHGDYFKWLGEKGYKPTEAEQLELAGKAPRS